MTVGCVGCLEPLPGRIRLSQVVDQVKFRAPTQIAVTLDRPLAASFDRSSRAQEFAVT